MKSKKNVPLDYVSIDLLVREWDLERDTAERVLSEVRDVLTVGYGARGVIDRLMPYCPKSYRVKTYLLCLYASDGRRKKR